MILTAITYLQTENIATIAIYSNQQRIDDEKQNWGCTNSFENVEIIILREHLNVAELI